MEYLRNYNDYLNESVLGDISRLNPDRKKRDGKAQQLVDDILEDFKKHDKDLKKVSIIDHGDNSINFNEIKIGKQYTLSYVFGKFHPVLRNLSTGNKGDFDRRVKITNVPFFLKIRKNQLERHFRTKRVKLSQTRIEDTKSTPNYSHNPRVKGQEHGWEVKEDRYRVSYDTVLPLFKYFIKEFSNQYPGLKGGKYKGYNSIRDLKHGINPTKKWISVKSKDGKDLSYDLKIGENESDVRKKLSGMTRVEYDDYWKEKQKELYKPIEKKRKELKEKWSKKIDTLLKNNDINLEVRNKWEPYGFSLSPINEYNFRLQFYSKDDQLDKKVRNFIKEDLSPYKLENWNVKEGYSKDGTYFAHLIYDTQS